MLKSLMMNERGSEQETNKLSTFADFIDCVVSTRTIVNSRQQQAGGIYNHKSGTIKSPQ